MCDIWVMCLLQITVMCVRVCVCVFGFGFGCEFACHCVCIHSWCSTLCECLCATLFCACTSGRRGDAFGRAPTLTDSVLIWCRVWRLSPYLMTRGRPCPFMMSENEERRVAECTESEAKHVFNPHTRAHRPQGLRWLSYLLTGEKPANCDQVCLCIFTFVWGIVRKVGLFWIPRLLLYC